MPLTTNSIYLIAVPMILSLVITPIMRKSAVKNGFVDRTGLHKAQEFSLPLLGGLGIYISIIISLLLFLPRNNIFITLIIASLVLVVTGHYDDKNDLKPAVKLGCQFIAATFMIVSNFSSLTPLINIFTRFNIPWFVTLIGMICFLILIINAFNLIDGMDGLSVGVAAILFLGMAVKTVITGGSNNILVLQLIGFGACIGFLPYNFHPAKIFMGDTGSMLLGFLLSVSFLFSISAENFGGSLVLGALYIFAYPVLDVAFAIYRRIRYKRSIFSADRSHIHHLFSGHGFSVRKTVLLIYFINIIFIIIGVVLIYFKTDAITVIITGIVSLAAAIWAIRTLSHMGIKQGLMKVGGRFELPPGDSKSRI